MKLDIPLEAHDGDRDINDQIIYSIDHDTYSEYFEIDAKTGLIKVSAIPPQSISIKSLVIKVFSIITNTVKFLNRALGGHVFIKILSKISGFNERLF